jgi:hypothetical protein
VLEKGGNAFTMILGCETGVHGLAVVSEVFGCTALQTAVDELLDQ